MTLKQPFAVAALHAFEWLFVRLAPDHPYRCDCWDFLDTEESIKRLYF